MKSCIYCLTYLTDRLQSHIRLILIVLTSLLATTPAIANQTQKLPRLNPQDIDGNLIKNRGYLIAAGIENFDPSKTINPLEPQPTPSPVLPPPSAPESVPSSVPRATPRSAPQPPPPPTPPAPPAPPPPSVSTGPQEFVTPLGILESTQTEFKSDIDRFGKSNFATDAVFKFGKKEGEKFEIHTGLYTFEQVGAETIRNVPVKVQWETKTGLLKLKPSFGVDLFSRGAAVPVLELKGEYPLTNTLLFSASIQQGAHKPNATTISNAVSAWRYGPGIVWKIDPETSLMSNLTFGDYSDGNKEMQSFTRFERKFGQFALAGNLFMWSYQHSTNNGYFAPSDFLVYSSEFNWEGNIFDITKCKIAIPFGNQSVNGTTASASGYNFRCNTKISDSIEFGLGYNYSNLKNQPGGLDIAGSEGWTTGLNIKF